MSARYEVTLSRLGADSSRARVATWHEACDEAIGQCEHAVERLLEYQNPTPRVTEGVRALRAAIRFYSGADSGRLPRATSGCMSSGDCAGFEVRVRRLRR